MCGNFGVGQKKGFYLTIFSFPLFHLILSMSLYFYRLISVYLNTFIYFKFNLIFVRIYAYPFSFIIIIPLYIHIHFIVLQESKTLWRLFPYFFGLHVSPYIQIFHPRCIRQEVDYRQSISPTSSRKGRIIHNPDLFSLRGCTLPFLYPPRHGNLAWHTLAIQSWHNFWRKHSVNCPKHNDRRTYCP